MLAEFHFNFDKSDYLFVQNLNLIEQQSIEHSERLAYALLSLLSNVELSIRAASR